MKKTEDARVLSIKSDSCFLAAAVALVTSSVMVNLAGVFGTETTAEFVMYVFCTVVMIAASLFTFVMTVKGFGLVKKSCMLDEKNVNYYLGRNLQRLSVATVLITVVLTLVTSFIFVLTSQYSTAEQLSSADYQAYNNLLNIVAVISIIMMIFDITLPYMIYLWKIHKSSGGDNFALLTVIIMLVQIIIASLNSVYSVRGSDNSFLSSFSVILEVVEGIALMLFFLKRRHKTVKE